MRSIIKPGLHTPQHCGRLSFPGLISLSVVHGGRDWGGLARGVIFGALLPLFLGLAAGKGGEGVAAGGRRDEPALRAGGRRRLAPYTEMPGSKLKFRNGTTVPLEVAPLFGDGRGALGLPEVENASLVIETPCGWMESGDIIRMVDLTQDEMPRGTVTYVAPFYGIRFAAPLTQTLRWKPPVPQPCWPNGTVLPTKNFGPGCLDSHGEQACGPGACRREGHAG